MDAGSGVLLQDSFGVFVLCFPMPDVGWPGRPCELPLVESRKGCHPS